VKQKCFKFHLKDAVLYTVVKATVVDCFMQLV